MWNLSCQFVSDYYLRRIRKLGMVFMVRGENLSVLGLGSEIFVDGINFLVIRFIYIYIFQEYKLPVG